MNELNHNTYYNDIKNINYNTNFLCTYRNFQEDYYSNLCYQIQMLQALNMDKYDGFILSVNIQKVYYFLQNNNEIIYILKLLKEKYRTTNMVFFIQDNDDALFQLLLSYDYFDIFHKCLINYIKDKLNNDFNEIKKYFDELKDIVTSEQNS